MRRLSFITILIAVILLALWTIPSVGHAQPQPPATLFPPGPVSIQLTPTAQATLAPGACPAALPASVGDQLSVLGGVNFRNLPTLSGAVVAYFQLPVVVTIVEGPVCADGINWWKIRGIGLPGWVAESERERYLVELVGGAGGGALCSEPQDIQIGERVRILNGVRVRAEANESAQVLTVAPYQSLLPVVGGPICAGDLNYWQVDAPFGPGGEVVRGWITEGPDYDYYIEPETRPLYQAATCFPPANFRVGERLIVLSTGGLVRNLRSAPSEQSPLVASLVGGIQVDVLAGPVCRDNFNWWQVQVYGGSDDPVGWVAEGTPGDYFIGRLPQRRGG